MDQVLLFHVETKKNSLPPKQRIKIRDSWVISYSLIPYVYFTHVCVRTCAFDYPQGWEASDPSEAGVTDHFYMGFEPKSL